MEDAPSCEAWAKSVIEEWNFMSSGEPKSACAPPGA